MSAQIRKLANLCFLKKTNCVPYLEQSMSGCDLIGTIRVDAGGAAWSLGIQGDFLQIESAYYSGVVKYEDIKSCEQVVIRKAGDLISHIDLYSPDAMEKMRHLPDSQISDLLSQENGVVLYTGDGPIRLLLAVTDFETTREITRQFRDFIRRVVVMRAWE